MTKPMGGTRPRAGRPKIHTVPMRQITLFLPVDLIDRLDEKAGEVGFPGSSSSWSHSRDSCRDMDHFVIRRIC
jgi:hypothetical protein